MPRHRFLVIVLSLSAISANAARESSTQRLHFKLSLAGQQPKLLLPKTNLVDLSAATMEKDESGTIMHLKGNVEVRLSTGARSPFPTTILRADEATYDTASGEIQTLGNLKISTESPH